MSSNDRVLRCDRVAASNSATVQTGIHLLNAGVHCLQAVQPLLELGRETPVCLDHVGEQCIAATGRAIQHIQERGAWGLLLEGDVGVPGDRIGALFEESGTGAIVRTAEDEMDLGEALGCAGGLVDVVSAEVSGVLDGVLDGEGREILIAECCLFGQTPNGDDSLRCSAAGCIPTTRR